MYSLVIKIAIIVERTVEEVITLPLLGLINNIVEVVIADPDPDKTSVIIRITFLLYISSYNNRYQI